MSEPLVSPPIEERRSSREDVLFFINGRLEISGFDRALQYLDEKKDDSPDLIGWLEELKTELEDLQTKVEELTTVEECEQFIVDHEGSKFIDGLTNLIEKKKKQLFKKSILFFINGRLEISGFDRALQYLDEKKDDSPDLIGWLEELKTELEDLQTKVEGLTTVEECEQFIDTHKGSKFIEGLTNLIEEKKEQLSRDDTGSELSFFYPDDLRTARLKMRAEERQRLDKARAESSVEQEVNNFLNKQKLNNEYEPVCSIGRGAVVKVYCIRKKSDGSYWALRIPLNLDMWEEAGASQEQMRLICVRRELGSVNNFV